MNIEIKMDLPFSYCKMCTAINPEKHQFGNGLGYYWAVIRCENETICKTVEEAREAETALKEAEDGRED